VLQPVNIAVLANPAQVAQISRSDLATLTPALENPEQSRARSRIPSTLSSQVASRAASSDRVIAVFLRGRLQCLSAPRAARLSAVRRQSCLAVHVGLLPPTAGQAPFRPLPNRANHPRRRPAAVIRRAALVWLQPSRSAITLADPKRSIPLGLHHPQIARC